MRTNGDVVTAKKERIEPANGGKMGIRYPPDEKKKKKKLHSMGFEPTRA